MAPIVYGILALVGVGGYFAYRAYKDDEDKDADKDEKGDKGTQKKCPPEVLSKILSDLDSGVLTLEMGSTLAKSFDTKECADVAASIRAAIAIKQAKLGGWPLPGTVCSLAIEALPKDLRAEVMTIAKSTNPAEFYRMADKLNAYGGTYIDARACLADRGNELALAATPKPPPLPPPPPGVSIWPVPGSACATALEALPKEPRYTFSDTKLPSYYEYARKISVSLTPSDFYNLADLMSDPKYAAHAFAIDCIRKRGDEVLKIGTTPVYPTSTAGYAHAYRRPAHTASHPFFATRR